MNREEFYALPQVKYYTDQGAYLRIETSISEYDKLEEGISVRTDASMCNKSGKKIIAGSTSRKREGGESAVLEKLAKNLTEKLQKVKEASTPLATLRARVEEITDLYFHNNDSAGRHGRNTTYNGWDVVQYHKSSKFTIKCHNAANPVLSFDLLDPRPNNIFINMVNISSGFDGSSQDLDVLPKLLQAVKDYYDSDLAIRKAELGIVGPDLPEDNSTRAQIGTLMYEGPDAW